MDANEHGRRLTQGPTSTPSEQPRGRFREEGEARVGQWTGTRYVLPPDGWRTPQISELVVLKRPDLAPLGRLLRANSLYGWQASPHPVAPYMLQAAELFAQGAPLRVGEWLTLVDLEIRPIDPTRLTPPGPLLSAAEMDRMMAPEGPPRPPVACAPDC